MRALDAIFATLKAIVDDFVTCGMASVFVVAISLYCWLASSLFRRFFFKSLVFHHDSRTSSSIGIGPTWLLISLPRSPCRNEHSGTIRGGHCDRKTGNTQPAFFSRLPTTKKAANANRTETLSPVDIGL